MKVARSTERCRNWQTRDSEAAERKPEKANNKEGCDGVKAHGQERVGAQFSVRQDRSGNGKYVLADLICTGLLETFADLLSCTISSYEIFVVYLGMLPKSFPAASASDRLH